MFRKGTYTAIGSWPFGDPGETVDLVLRKFPGLPAWPQLPKTGFAENMYVQFSEGLPRVVVDTAAGRIHFDTSGDFFPDIEAVYEDFLAERWDRFAISRAYASGLYALREELNRRGTRLGAVKGQALGPVSLGLTLTDEHKRLILYNDALSDAILKACVGKAAWQVRFLKDLADSVVLFIDEPYLVSFGSAYVNITRDQVITMLNEVIGKIHELGGLAGIHCCGNTDWSVVADTEVDIINFDAHGYAESILLYPEKIGEFLGRSADKYLAWGIVPTAEQEVAAATPEELLAKLKKFQRRLGELGVKSQIIEERTILTPACGTGSLPETTARRVIDLLETVSHLYQAG
jgi:hypothetical protein